MTSIYKFSGLDSYKLACMASNTIWFSSLDDFNDPFEGCVLITAEDDSNENINTALKNIYSLLVKNGEVEAQNVGHKDNYSHEERETLRELIHEYFKSELQAIKQIAACSFMDAGDEVLTNQYMWSHYANGLRGYCLSFNKEKLIRSLATENNEYYLGSMNIKYSSTFPSIDAIEYFCSFDDRLNYAFIAQSLAPRLKIYSAASTKSSNWSNEKEFRLLSGKRGSLKYASEAIEEIVIGEKMPIDQQILIIRILKSVNPDIVIRKAVMDKDSYNLKVVAYES